MLLFQDVEQTGSTDIDEVLLLAFLAFGVVFILAIAFDYKSLAGLGVGEIGSFLSPVQAFFNLLGVEYYCKYGYCNNYEKEKINATLSAEGSGCFFCGVCENH